jgi:hypothetical protein
VIRTGALTMMSISCTPATRSVTSVKSHFKKTSKFALHFGVVVSATVSRGSEGLPALRLENGGEMMNHADCRSRRLSFLNSRVGCRG